jgi:hypothetical protein
MRRRRTAKTNLLFFHDLPVFTPHPRARSKRAMTKINLILLDLALFAPSPHTRRRFLLLGSLQRGALAEARRTLRSSSSSTALKLDALGRVPAAVSAVEVVLLDGRAGPGARVRRAGPLVAVGQLVDVAVQVDATAVEALAVLLAGTPLAVIVVGLVGTARGPAVVVAIVTVVTVVSVPLAIAVAVAVPVAVTFSIAVSLPVTVTMLAVAVVTAVAVSLPVPVTVTIMVPVPLPVSVAVADGGRAALREQNVGRAGLAVVTLTLGHGMAALGLIRVVLGAAAPHGTGTAAMRALTSVTMAVGAVTAALALLLGLVVLLLEAADVLLKGAPSGVIGADGLEGGHMSKSAPNLLVSVINADGGFHPLHVRAEVL